MGYDREVEMVRSAASMDLLTAIYCLTEDEARAMTDAGADVIVAHMGLTVKGRIGARTAMSLDEAASRTQAIRDAAIAINPDVIVLCHGGPIAEPDDARYVLANTTGVAGFFGASSMERLPTEIAITDRVREFKAISN